jgi:hypothetical protein
MSGDTTITREKIFACICTFAKAIVNKNTCPQKPICKRPEVGPGQKIRDGSTIRIRHGVVFLFPAIREQYVRTIYSGSVRRHYLRTYYVLSYSNTHWIRHGTGDARLDNR